MYVCETLECKESDGAMKMGNRDDVPGTTGRQHA